MAGTAEDLALASAFGENIVIVCESFEFDNACIGNTVG